MSVVLKDGGSIIPELEDLRTYPGDPEDSYCTGSAFLSIGTVVK